MRPIGALKKQPCTAVRTTTFRESAAVSRRTSACTISTTYAAVFRSTDCRGSSANIPSFAALADLLCFKACNACASCFGTRVGGASYPFVRWADGVSATARLVQTTTDRVNSAVMLLNKHRTLTHQRRI